MTEVRISVYADMMSKRSPDVVARELDRLQAKLALYRKRLEDIAMRGGDLGRMASDAIEEAMRI